MVLKESGCSNQFKSQSLALSYSIKSTNTPSSNFFGPELQMRNEHKLFGHIAFDYTCVLMLFHWSRCLISCAEKNDFTFLMITFLDGNKESTEESRQITS